MGCCVFTIRNDKTIDMDSRMPFIESRFISNITNPGGMAGIGILLKKILGFN